MDNEFYTLLTDRGMAKIASALADKKQLHLQKMAVGDGGGQYYEPTASQIKLRHEVWRGEMNTLTTAPNNPNWLIAELVLPEDVGGWYVREVGVFDDEGELIAIGKFPESYKPLLPGGCGKQVCIRLIMEVSNTTAVTLTVDPSIVLATRDYVDSLLDEHEHSTNHPDATLTQKGFTQLSNATDSDDETKAATPKAVKAAMAQARNHTHTWNQITDVPDGTLLQKGIVKLNAATNSSSTSEAATPSAVREAYELANSKAAANHTHAWSQITDVPDGTLTQKGIVKLNSATNSTSTTEAATPSAVKAAMDKASAALNLANTAASNGPRYQFFTANGTFTVPDGVTQVFVEMLGGGGGGGGGGCTPDPDKTNTFSAGRGGNHGELKIAVIDVTSKKTYTVSVGAGGSGGGGGFVPSYEDRTSIGPNGGHTLFKGDAGELGLDGGDSSFINITAKGGLGSGGKIAEFTSTESSPGGIGVGSAFGTGGSAAAFANGGNADGYGAGGGGGASLNQNTRSAISGYSGGRGSDGFVKISW
ncbi:tail protein [Salmonella enterica]|uniref:Tail protein n=1 Tax=Salmonella enterica TaxID=28901 RepID=A0A379QDX1_SALER|nr:phage tail protein [Salmonella enterica subsp. salamae serovar Springs]SUF39797.1 tail protein [Salmonella enterica]HCM1985206.1 phage tail protein [Salmonella enterica subsp. salamae serovar 40:a:z39]